MNIAFVYSDNALEINSSHYRCLIPARALNAAGHTASQVWIESFQNGHADTLLKPADVIVIERNLFGSAHREMRRWAEQGKLIVADFDDPYDLLTPSFGPSFQLWGQGIARRADGSLVQMSPHPLVQFRQALGLAHLATTPCQRLCDDWAPWARATRLRPNWLEWPLYADVQREPHEGVWIGWGGSNGHLASWQRSGLLPALRRVFRARPEARLVVFGLPGAIQDCLDLPEDRFVVRDWVKFADWPRECAQFDIGLAPLAGAYDERRSWLKPLEYMACGVPWIGSNYPNYRDLAVYGMLVENTPDAWESALLTTIDSLLAGAHLAAGALSDHYSGPRAFARSQCADRHVAELVELFEQARAEVSAERAAPARVSVVLPCYNMANYLPDAVESVVAQTFQGWELVIVDDGSTDETPAMIAALQARFPLRRIQVVQQVNSGLPAARNAGIEVAGGEYILPLDADDALLPDTLKTLVAALDSQPEIGIAYPDYFKFGLEAGNVFAIPTEEYYNARRPLNGLPYCSLYRKSAWRQAGGYDPEMRGAVEDWEFWLAMLEAGVQAVHVQELLFAYRVRADSQSVTAETILPEAMARMRGKHPALFAEEVPA